MNSADDVSPPDIPVLLTGGTGYLGRSIVAALRESGRAVRVLARTPDSHRDLEGPGVELVRGDVTDADSLLRAAEGTRGTIHAAATVTSWERDSSTFDRVNVESLRHVLRAAAAANSGKVVFVSSFFALGPTDGSIGDEESGGAGRREFNNDYERTKSLAEREARAAQESGAPLVIVYPGLLYGPGPLREANFTAGLILDARRGRLPGLPGGGTRRWCFTYVADAAEGCVLALEKGNPGERFLLTGENHTLREFFDAVEAAGGPAVPRRSLPFWLMNLAGWGGEMLARLGGPRPRVTRGAVAIFRHDWAFSSRRAEERLRWRTRSLAEGTAATLASLREAGLLRG